VRVLVVEDEEVLAAAIARGLREEAMAVEVSHDGGDALERLARDRYDVLVLDRDLPGVHGDEVCRALVNQRASRASGETEASRASGSPVRPMILMLTAAGAIEDRVDGLTIGADDYLAKPFAFAELVARVRALARHQGAPASRPSGLGASRASSVGASRAAGRGASRASGVYTQPLPPVLTRYDVTLDPARQEVTRGGHFVRLSRKQLSVLEVLMAADGAVVSTEELLEKAWDERIDPFTNIVRVTVMKLRRKLGDPPLIETIPGVGYRL
jgi:DNA-binding response OmpR family regulator